MKKICVLTATRAEYGLLKSVIEKLSAFDDTDVRVAVTGMHLSPEFGLTYREIEADGIRIDKKIDILLSSDTPAAISKTMALATSGFADYFAELAPDMLVVLGDRYETLAVCIAAMNARIPIAHLYGGETTEGAVDECIRHAITKMSYLHFTSTDEYRKRVIQLGESPDRVFSVGATGIENILRTKLMDKSELSASIGLSLEAPYCVVTFHPVTLEGADSRRQFSELLAAVDARGDMGYIFSKANSDADGRVINAMIDEYAATHENAVAFSSLGMVRYLSALKYCALVVGNSSSGLIEAPSFHIPTVNIGDRQKGRCRAETVIDCLPTKASILAAFEKGLSESFRRSIANAKNPYGDGDTSSAIAGTIHDRVCEGKIDLKKKFHDVSFDV